MKALLVAPTDVTTFLGGLEQHVRSLAAHLSKRDHQVAIAVPGRTPGRTLLTDGVEVIRLRAGFSYINSLFRATAVHPQFTDPAFARSLRQLVKEWQPDLVHSHGLAALSVGPALRGAGTPWVHTLHDYALLCPKATLWKLPEGNTCNKPMTLSCIPCHSREAPRGLFSPLRPLAILPALALSRASLPIADSYVANSRFVAEAHRRFFPNIGDRITVISMFLDPEENKDNVVNPCPDLPEAPFILFAGSAAAQKGAHILLEAFRSIPGNVSLVLMVTGPTEWLDQLRSKADDRTIFYHNAPHNLVMAAWKRALFGVVPSLWAEPFGIVAIEPMSHAKPVIASATGGLSDIVIDGETGILVAPGDVEALRLALERLIDNESLRQQMGRAAKERFQQEFSAEVVVPKIEDLYSGLRSSTVGARQ